MIAYGSPFNFTANTSSSLKAVPLPGLSPYTHLDAALRSEIAKDPDTVAICQTRQIGGEITWFAIKRTLGKKAVLDLSGVIKDGVLPPGLRRWEFAPGAEVWEMRLIAEELR